MKSPILIVFLIFLHVSLYSQRDSIFTTSGKIIKCKITDQDSTAVYFNIRNKGNEIQSFVKKSDVVSIKEYVKKPISSSFLNLGVGFGPSYGILGTHAILGVNNSGLLVGFGVSPHGLFSQAIGVQGALDWFFINVGYGVYAEYRFDDGPYQKATGAFFNAGGMINLGKLKRMYLEIGLGGSINNIPDESYHTFEIYNYRGSVGIGYRFESK